MEGMQLASKTILAVLSFFWAASVAAQSYTVQVGAFREPASNFVDAAANHGEVVREENAKGLTLISVGRFSQRSSAEALLEKMASSYPGAYVRSIRGTGVQPSPSKSALAKRPAVNRSAQASAGFSVAELRTGKGPLLRGNRQDQDLFRQLSVEDRERVVSLDGQLHMKVGDRFVRLSEYVR